MKPSVYILAIIACSLSTCSSSFQGIRFRSQAPSIEEAFRKLSLAVSADDYQISQVDPVKFSIETSWRALKVNEKSEADLGLKDGIMESKMMFRLERRGQMYDVFAAPTIRNSQTATETIADTRHPLWHKWRRILNTLLQKESKEEE
jgi:hypothetical protein